MSKLRDAIDNDLLTLRYQPIIDIASGKITHHEVLLRMQGEDGKTISPDAFLPAAVRFGLMAEIDYWVVQNAIAGRTGPTSGLPSISPRTPSRPRTRRSGCAATSLNTTCPPTP